MTVAEKKIELVQALLLLQDKTALFEIEQLIARALHGGKSGNEKPDTRSVVSYEAWLEQFEAIELSGPEDEYGMTPADLLQRIWVAEQSKEMSLETFFKRIA